MVNHFLNFLHALINKSLGAVSFFFLASDRWPPLVEFCKRQTVAFYVAVTFYHLYYSTCAPDDYPVNKSTSLFLAQRNYFFGQSFSKLE